MRKLRFLNGLLYLLITSSITFAQPDSLSDKFDEWINSSLALSEQALFAAALDDAARFCDISSLETSALLRSGHRITLTLQGLRIQAFRRILYLEKYGGAPILEILESLRPSLAEIEDNNILGEFYVALASALYAAGMPDSAKGCQQQAKAYFQSAGNIKKVAQVRGNEISRLQNRLRAAGETDSVLALIPAYEKEIAFASDCDNKYVLAYNTRHLAQIYRRHTDDLEKAKSLFKTSLALREEIGFRPFIPASYSSIGDVAVRMGDDKQAITMYEKAAALATEIGFIRYQVQPHINIGDIYLSQKNIAAAKKHYGVALKTASAKNYQAGIDTALMKLESLYDKQMSR